MEDRREFTFSLPADMAEALERKVERGEIDSVEQGVREGVQSLLDRDVAFERFLWEEVVPAYDAHVANPSTAIPADEVFDRILARRAARRAPMAPSLALSTIALA